MLGRYRSLFAVPHVPRLVVAGVIGRLNAGLPLSLVLLVREATGSYAVAGAAAAANTATFALIAPLRGRLVDRHYPARVIVPMAIAQGGALAGLVVAANLDVAAWVLVAICATVGATQPPLGTSMRTLWSWLAPGPNELQAAYSLEAMLNEVGFIGGPLLAGGLVALWSPTAAVIVMAALMLVGNLLFASARPAREWRGEPREPGGRNPLVSPAMQILVLSSVPLGAAIVALDVVAPAFAEEHGSASAAGLMLAALALGSLLGGLWYGAQRATDRPLRRYAALCGLLALGFAPLALAGSNLALGLLLVVAGFGFAPSSACANQVIDEHAPAGTASEAWSWILSAYMAGAAIGGALGGVVVEEVGVTAGLAASSALVALAAVYAVADTRLRGEAYRPLRRSN